MQQFIVLASPDGVVDMTPQAIAARTSIPLDILIKGIKILSEPDPYTRTPGEEGRRIVLMDDHRPWGWRLVNHGKYRALRDMEQKREADRERIADKRKKNKDVAIASHDVANVAHTDSDTHSDSDTDTELPLASQESGNRKVSIPACQHDQIIDLYHEILPMGRQVRKNLWNGTRAKHLQARWREDAERQSLLWWGKFFHHCAKSPFLSGRIPSRRPGERPFEVSLDWIIEPGNFVKIIEGKYDE